MLLRGLGGHNSFDHPVYFEILFLKLRLCLSIIHTINTIPRPNNSSRTVNVNVWHQLRSFPSSAVLAVCLNQSLIELPLSPAFGSLLPLFKSCFQINYRSCWNRKTAEKQPANRDTAKNSLRTAKLRKKPKCCKLRNILSLVTILTLVTIVGPYGRPAFVTFNLI